MDDYDDLREYDSHTVHDMYVDSDYEINTGELPYVKYEDDLDNFIDNLNDWD